MRPGSLAAAILFTLGAAPALAQEPDATRQCMSLAEERKLAEAEPFCVKAAAESREGKLLYGDFLSHRGDFQGAAARYTEALAGHDKANPTSTALAALRRRAIAHYRLENAAGASEDAAAFLAHRPDDLEILQLGAMTTPWNDVRIRYADKLVTLQPKNVDFHVFRASALAQAGKHQEALDAVELALKLDPKSETALSTRGFIHGAMGDHSKALKDQARAARLSPNDTQAKTSQAQALVEAKHYAEAIEAATEALALRPDNVDALAIRAYARLNMGDGEGAVADLESAARADPDSDWSEAKVRARHVTEMQALMRPESIAQIEADRRVILDFVEAHLHGQCGHYSVRPYEDNEGLNAYRQCILAWHKTEDQAFIDSVPAHIIAAGERFNDAMNALEGAEVLKCSVMPKKSRCVDDALFTRLDAAAAGMADPKDVVGGLEYERLNREVIAYNASVKRQNALAKTASFLDALANELSKQ